MKWHTAASDHKDLEQALQATAARLARDLEGQPPDVLLVFATQHHLFNFGRIGPFLQEAFNPGVLLGCSAGGVIGGGVEIEQRPGLTLTAATLPGVEWRLLHLDQEELPPLDGSPTAWRKVVGVDPDVDPHFVVLADPFTLNANHLLQGLDFAYAGAPKIGGLASGAQGAGSNALFADSYILRTGALVLSMWGDIEIDTVLAQGCRPVGAPARVTGCEGQLLKSLDDRPPVDVLQEIYAQLPVNRRSGQAVFLGVVMDELREEIGPGDFLIRNIIGMDRDTGMIAVGAELREGQTVQFHLRDGEAAAQDLDAVLAHYQKVEDAPPAGALLFSCVGRGQSLFGEADHDSRRFRESIAPVPVGGFFCNGEIGPVAGTTYLHGYTSAFGIVRPRRRS